tara:strand:- start:337 stop:615 length:279 start_codon:yes stop_codon:yes gene_type:complete
MTKKKDPNEPINIADRLRREYKKAGLNKKMPDTINLTVKSIMYTALIILAIGFVIIGGAVLIPIGIFVLVIAIIFACVKAVLSHEEEKEDEN